MSFVWRDGSRFTPRMLYDFERLAAAFAAEFPGFRLFATSALRLHSEQVALFLERFVVQSTGVGPFGDVRWWDGRRWVRVRGPGTVAPPGTSNHEFESTGYGAVDVRDNGKDPGVTIAGNARSNWMRANCSRFNFEPEGYQFREPWHLKYVGPLWAGVPGGAGDGTGGAVAPPTDDDDDDTEGQDMNNSGFWYSDTGSAGPTDTVVYLIANPVSGWWHEYSNGPGLGPMPGGYNNGVAAAFRTGSFQRITASHARTIRRSLDALRSRVVDGSLRVEINAGDLGYSLDDPTSYTGT